MARPCRQPRADHVAAARLPTVGREPIPAKILAQLAGFLFTFVVLEIDSCSGALATSGRTGRSTTGIRFPPRAGRAGIMSTTLRDLVSAHAPRRKPLAVLELGGGNSCFLDGLMQHFTMAPTSSSTTLREGMRLARERFATSVRRSRRVHQDDVFAANPERRFDLVFSVGLIEHFDDHAMQKLVGLHRRWAAPDGLVLIAVPTPTIFYRLVPDDRRRSWDSGSFPTSVLFLASDWPR